LLRAQSLRPLRVLRGGTRRPQQRHENARVYDDLKYHIRAQGGS
jgi:hypothetical protein